MKTPPPDKTLHFAAGALCAAAGVLAALLAGVSLPMGGAAATAAAALAREAYNRRQGGLFDWRDIAATMLGAVPVLAAAWAGAA